MKPENYKYHLALRLKGYDYSKPGIYFITICTKDRQELFGKVENCRSILNNIGLVAGECWMEVPRHFPNASLMDYIVMPDHLHGLICLNEKEDGTIYRASTEKAKSFGKPIIGSIPTIIRAYKAAVTRIINRNNSKSRGKIHRAPIWQPGYYEHIIRDEEELNYTINYIKSNPSNWETERNIS
jgi:REP element-mobilizing transposase RayT